MFQDELVAPSRLQVLREIDRMLKGAETIEAARADYRELVLALILGE